MSKKNGDSDQNLETIGTIDADKAEWRVIIETPKGSCCKYTFNPEFNVFELAQVLPEGLAFPFDFGFLPSTLGEDGDPLDVLLLMDQPTFCGCMVASRLIGVIEALQTERDGIEQRNDRLLAIPTTSRRFAKVRSVNDLDTQFCEEVARFFMTYNDQKGKKFRVLDFRGPKRAESLARAGMKLFTKRQRTRRRTKKP